MSEEQVILVDGADHEIGNAGKLYAHQQGLLHRAISVFIFNSTGEWLLQKRASNKYHSGGLWTNTCCSHPRAGEETSLAAHRRLKEEMGIECTLKFLFSFRYRAEVGNDLIEHELDHVYVGISDALPHPNPEEVAEWKRFTTEEIEIQLQREPEKFTKWFVKIFERVRDSAR